MPCTAGDHTSAPVVHGTHGNDLGPPSHPRGIVESVIYALTPSSGTDNAQCVGVQWNPTIAGGWTCMVAVAEDRAGNLGISKPLRVCYAASCDPAQAPPCTDGCTMPTPYTDWGPTSRSSNVAGSEPEFLAQPPELRSTPRALRSSRLTARDVPFLRSTFGSHYTDHTFR